MGYDLLLIDMQVLEALPKGRTTARWKKSNNWSEERRKRQEEELTSVTNSVFMPSSRHQCVDDRALQEVSWRIGLVVCGETRRGSFYSQSLHLEAIFVQFYGGTQHDRGDCSGGGGLGLILLVPSHL